MDYQKKLEYAKQVAEELQGQKTTEQIKEYLKAEGLYERDIDSVFISAKNFIGDSYKDQIKEYLLADKEILSAEEFKSLDKEMLEKLIADEKRVLGIAERKKITKLLKEGHEPQEIMNQVDTRFISQEHAQEQLAKQVEIKQHNSGGGRMLNIGGGIGLIILTGVIAVTTERLFYVIPLIGLGMIIKGFMTEKMDYED